ncbi:MAG: hypothetical protein H0W16_04065 [Actinobacteria bacterium]|nr:hypothetical protein [Actinomycetota bacterium]
MVSLDRDRQLSSEVEHDFAFDIADRVTRRNVDPADARGIRADGDFTDGKPVSPGENGMAGFVDARPAAALEELGLALFTLLRLIHETPATDAEVDARGSPEEKLGEVSR